MLIFTFLRFRSHSMKCLFIFFISQLVKKIATLAFIFLNISSLAKFSRCSTASNLVALYTRFIKMGRGKTISKDIRQLVIDRFNNGEKSFEISRSLGKNKSIISRIIAQYKAKGIVGPKPIPGRPKVTSKNTDRLIVRLSKQNPFLSSTKILGHLEGLGAQAVSARTVRRRLVDAGLFSRRPAKKPLLSKKNVKARLNFAQKYVDWTPDQWKKVVWSDESKFNLFRSDGMSYVRRPVGKRLNKKYIAPTVKHGGGSVMVWGCFSGYGMGPLHRITGIMDKFMYRDILREHLIPYMDDKVPLRSFFQQDNDPKHSSKLIKKWFQDEKIAVLPWPSQSPDLNPIENMWEFVDGKIRDKNYSNLNDLFLALQKSWREISEDYINKLILSMPKRCASVIQEKGYYTKY